MDDWFCKSRNHRREAHLRADDLAQLKCALSRARFGDVLFPLTEDLHGATSCGGSEAESIERDRVRLHKFEAGKPDRLLVERQRARTPGPRSKLCNQRVCK